MAKFSDIDHNRIASEAADEAVRGLGPCRLNQEDAARVWLACRAAALASMRLLTAEMVESKLK